MAHVDNKRYVAHFGPRVVSPPMTIAPTPVPPKVETPKKEVKVNLIGILRNK